jgi:predicted component of type VI protein secretion system
VTILTKKEVIARLNAFCDRFETYAEAASALRCTPSQLSQARLGKTGLIPAPILKKLKIKTVTVYESQDKALAKPHRKTVAPAAAKPLAKPAKKPSPAPVKPRPAPAALPAPPEKGDTTPPPLKVAKARVIRKPAALGAGYGEKVVEPGDPYANAVSHVYNDEVIDDGNEDDPQFNPAFDMPGSRVNVFED